MPENPTETQTVRVEVDLRLEKPHDAVGLLALRTNLNELLSVSAYGVEEAEVVRMTAAEPNFDWQGL
jgi:hypothetical protein